MLIASLYFIVFHVLPALVSIIAALSQSIGLIIIILFGITLMFAAVGVNISSNLMSSIFNGIFRLFGLILTASFHAIGWIVVGIFALMPRIYRSFRESIGNSLLAALLTIIVVAIII